MNIRKMLALVIATAPIFSHCALAAETDLATDAINFGRDIHPQETHARATVFLIVALFNKGKVTIGYCSGSLIEKDLVLTAAHCLGTDGATAIGVKAVLATGKQVVDGKVWKAHPQFEGKTKSSFLGMFKQLIVRNDIALIRLDTPAIPEAVISALPSANLKPGRRYLFSPVGYGKPDGNESSKVGVIRTGQSFGSLASARDGSFQFIRITDGAMTCRGDSGGPIFLETSDERPVVAGLTSHGDPDCKDYSVATSVGHFLGWIRATSARLH